MLHRLIDSEALVICAVNGPATIDAELMVMGDITLAADHADRRPSALHCWRSVRRRHAPRWQELLGPNRGKYYFLAGQKIDADGSQELGIVNEVLSSADFLPRSIELAHQLTTYDASPCRPN